MRRSAHRPRGRWLHLRLRVLTHRSRPIAAPPLTLVSGGCGAESEVSVTNIQKAASDALSSQNACNLSGVVHAFARACEALWDQPECSGTDWVNGHPISVLFAAQISYLSGTPFWASQPGERCRYRDAARSCRELAGVS